MKYRHPGFATADATVAKGNVWTWIAGKRYTPQQKSGRINLYDVHKGMERI